MKYHISISKTIDPINDIIENISSNEIKAISINHAVSKAIQKANIKLKEKYIEIILENNIEFTAYFDNYDLYGYKLPQIKEVK